jgi:hypothetical protein
MANKSKRAVEVGWFEGRSPITVRPEIEVGSAWEATAEHFNQAALGATPEEAVDNLIRALHGRGISGRGYSDTAKCHRLLAKEDADAA